MFYGLLFSCSVLVIVHGQIHTPTAENFLAKKEFKDKKIGIFIHWGASSVLGQGEFVMNNRNIGV